MPLLREGPQYRCSPLWRREHPRQGRHGRHPRHGKPAGAVPYSLRDTRGSNDKTKHLQKSQAAWFPLPPSLCLLFLSSCQLFMYVYSHVSFQKPKHPTTGLIAITLAFHICHEVHLAGFKYDFTDRNSSLHYYGNDTMSQMMQVTSACLC